MNRTAHYVSSTHWDREWYDTFQGFRMRLVSLLDEVFDVMETRPAFRSFVMDGQVVPVYDYLEIRPEMRDTVARFLADGRLKIGPWYVLPDEWLVSGESLIRNLKEGMRCAVELGAEPSRAGFLCDMFGHTGQMPQILVQAGVKGALIWRGLNEKEHGGLLNWKAPDGTVIPSYRFGKIGYCSYAIAVRDSRNPDSRFNPGEAAERLVAFTLEQSRRTPRGPILLFDGGDHLEIEPLTPDLIARANERLAESGIVIVHSDLDAYLTELEANRQVIGRTVVGELRESGRDPVAEDEQWLIPGVLSSRIHLKQKNAACEDELCLWAEPFSAFAAGNGGDYPLGYLRAAWKHLLDNHPHDSMCGCSIDQVHADMLYRFDQSLGIASRLTHRAMKTIALAASPGTTEGKAFAVTVFNPAAEPVSEAVDIDIPLPSDWPVFKEFFGYEDKFSFRLKDEEGNDIPYQLVSQKRDRMGFRVSRTKFPTPDERHVAGVTASLSVPACGYTTVVVEPSEGPVRYSGSLMTSHRSMENEYITVEAAPNGTIAITDKRSGKRLEGLMTFEERADIGDGWYHGLAVNDAVFSSAASSADIAIVADGREKATLRIEVTMNVPGRFNFHDMVRCEEKMPLRIVSDVTLRKGADRVEVETTVENTVLDHRLRILFPTFYDSETYMSDACFDAVERPVALADDNDMRRELDVETRPQISWTACANGKSGLAVVSRGLPESAVTASKERAIALTLLRGFRKAVLTNDNPGGQILGRHTFRYWIVPFSGPVPVKRLFVLGQRVNCPFRTVDIQAFERTGRTDTPAFPATQSFLSLEGKAVVSSIQRDGEKLLVRLFNPFGTTEKIVIRRPEESAAVACVTLDGRMDNAATVVSNTGGLTELLVPPKRIATVLFG